MSSKQEPVVLGKLGSSHGIKGWLKITTYTDSVEGIFDYSPWLLKEQGEWREVKVLQWRMQGKAVVACLEGVETRDQAQALTNCEIAVPAEQMNVLPEDEFYWRDLIGCEVVNTKGYNMGKVQEIVETGSNDVLLVKANAKDGFGKAERMVPFVTEQFILKVDLTAKQILVDWDPDF
ncbi:ribosome maturation factor RimM [Shewanella sp. Choline-02u-19]|jgi:16S rRNA processing protein RimM|uniref:ribosome maturation factor RimM n=1 Tax=Shewanella TaxID=22 RepID=UPI000C32099E|nr:MULTISPECIES: ribosome maturation factor RimM [Shewanella]MCL1056942.1 ribosome maturation factor RimM [Shewanella gelidimarina]PKG57216.1 ribosome maturation factor RimM [Shewanella sp. GutDb-MelDb]PKG76454.1 ribosome maturation factor RimM [Shewanella sp. GutCb]PKH57576.1 ribosome maturation factor RimM [Shewanella sp. Bg11-22]PKI28437.1 ribosome maturation factor RimM [Shewanella sp. Choline-02u-19]